MKYIYETGHCGVSNVYESYMEVLAKSKEEALRIAEEEIEKLNEYSDEDEAFCPHCGMYESLQWGRNYEIVQIVEVA